MSTFQTICNDCATYSESVVADVAFEVGGHGSRGRGSAPWRPDYFISDLPLDYHLYFFQHRFTLLDSGANLSVEMRYYEQRYPEVDELVMVQVRQIAEMGAYVKLVCQLTECPVLLWERVLNGIQLEYDNIEGMILLSELSRRRIRSIQKLIRVGRNEVVVVLRVDKEKGWILFDS